ncbi:hypothetical protein, partial [Collinsella sp. TM09-10AT]|uniref:hypothetical protein n=1 Tax=Collinsella sp. TM09-10AT TaxID=2292343 RepID=UPI001F2E4AEE
VIEIEEGGGLAASPFFALKGDILYVIKSILSSAGEYKRSPFCGWFSVLNGLIFALAHCCACPVLHGSFY